MFQNLQYFCCPSVSSGNCSASEFITRAVLDTSFQSPFQSTPFIVRPVYSLFPNNRTSSHLSVYSYSCFLVLRFNTSFLLFTCMHLLCKFCLIDWQTSLFYVVHQIWFLFLVCSAFLSFYNYSYFISMSVANSLMDRILSCDLP